MNLGKIQISISKLLSLFVLVAYAAIIYTHRDFSDELLWLTEVTLLRILLPIFLAIIGFILIWYNDDTALGPSGIGTFVGWVLFLLPLLGFMLYKFCVKGG